MFHVKHISIFIIIKRYIITIYIIIKTLITKANILSFKKQIRLFLHKNYKYSLYYLDI